MTVTLTQAANTYLDDIADSQGVKGIEYVKHNGSDLLVTNIGMTIDEADSIAADWIKRHEAQR
jgi:hypothetical protein